VTIDALTSQLVDLSKQRRNLQRGTASWCGRTHDNTFRYTLNLILLGEQRGVELRVSEAQMPITEGHTK
jgi:hypothetical protein